MAERQRTQRFPHYDYQRRMWYTFDTQNDAYEYENGWRCRRPDNVDPRSLGTLTPRNIPAQQVVQQTSASQSNVRYNSSVAAGSQAPLADTRRDVGESQIGYMDNSMGVPLDRGSLYTYDSAASIADFSPSNLADRTSDARGSSYRMYPESSLQRLSHSMNSINLNTRGQSQPLSESQANYQQPRSASPTTAHSEQQGINQQLTNTSGHASAPIQASASKPTRSGLQTASLRQVAPRQYEREGLRVIEAYNEHNQVLTTIATDDLNPTQSITDPGLLDYGVKSEGLLMGNGQEGEQERLYSSFSIRPHRFFQVGRVFLVLWVEPAGTTVFTGIEKNDRNAALIAGRFQDEFIYSKVRRFVVIRESRDYCSALPIVSYGHQGVGKKGVNKSEHAIIYTGTEPTPMLSEMPIRGEPGMRRTPIRVIPDNPTDKLDPVSRIDFGKVHTVQHNIKVKPFGMIHQRSMSALQTQFRNAWYGEAMARALVDRPVAETPHIPDATADFSSRGGDYERNSFSERTGIPSTMARSTTVTFSPDNSSVRSNHAVAGSYGSRAGMGRGVSTPSLAASAMSETTTQRDQTTINHDEESDDEDDDAEDNDANEDEDEDDEDEDDEVDNDEVDNDEVDDDEVDDDEVDDGGKYERPTSGTARARLGNPEAGRSIERRAISQAAPQGQMQHSESVSCQTSLIRSVESRMPPLLSPAELSQTLEDGRALEARSTQEAYRRMLLTNSGRQHAFATLVRNHRNRYPQLSAEQADAAVRAHLAYRQGQ